MWVWWLLIVIVPVLGSLSEKYEYFYRDGEGLKARRANKIFYIAACALLIFFAGLRSTTGAGVLSIGDTRVYTGLFRTIVKDNVVDFLRSTDFEGDWGFYAFMSLCKQIFHVQEQGLFFICSLLTIGALCFRYYKLNTMSNGLLFFLFITMGLYLGTMNGVRQYLVSALLFLAFPLIEKKKWIPYFIIVVTLSTMHSSALIFILFYFIANRPAWGNVMKGMIVATIILMITYPITGRFVAALLSSGSYSQYSDTILSSGGGSNILRIAVYIAPVILAFRSRERMKYEPHYNIIVNFSVLNMLFMILAFQNWIYARICIYLTPYWLMLFVWDLKYAFTQNSKKLVLIGYGLLCCFFFWYEINIGYGGQIYTSEILGIGR